MCETCHAQSGSSSSRSASYSGAPVAGAARVVLAVRADEEERVAGRLAVAQVEPSEVVVGLELGSCDLGHARPRRDGEREQPRVSPAIGAPDEEEPSVRRVRHLVAQVPL